MEKNVKKFITYVIHEKAYAFNDGYGEIDFKGLKIDDSNTNFIKCEIEAHVGNDVYSFVFFDNELHTILKNHVKYFSFDFDIWDPKNLKELIEKIG